jgi:Holliday junction resolvase RusA-like endonuclease
MPAIFELLLPRRPLSYQAKDSHNKQAWKDYIYGRAFTIWKQNPISAGPLRFTTVYLCERDPCDINNIIKPIQDALNSLVYADDSLIRDVTGHMRLLSEPIDIVGLPEQLQDAVIQGSECVYISISESSELNLEVWL